MCSLPSSVCKTNGFDFFFYPITEHALLGISFKSESKTINNERI